MAAPRPVASLPSGASTAATRCSVLGSLTVVGDFWTLAVIRCATDGMRRFAQLQRELGVAPNVLSDRLACLVATGVLERVPYQDRPPRHEYVLTEAGRELAPVILALKRWGDRHLQPDGAWTMVRHRGGCEHPLDVVIRCPDCGATPAAEDAETVLLRAAE